MISVRREALNHRDQVDDGIERYKDGIGWVVRKLEGFGVIVLSDDGSTLQIVLNAVSLLSGTFAIDSTGVKTVTTVHTRSSTPNIKDVQLTVSENTNVDDFELGYVKVESTDATNIVAKVNVTVASATAGATAKLNIWVTVGT